MPFRKDTQSPAPLIISPPLSAPTNAYFPPASPALPSPSAGSARSRGLGLAGPALAPAPARENLDANPYRQAGRTPSPAISALSARSAASAGSDRPLIREGGIDFSEPAGQRRWGLKREEEKQQQAANDEVDGLGLGMRGYDEQHYDSPTHSYLNLLETVPSSHGSGSPYPASSNAASMTSLAPSPAPGYNRQGTGLAPGSSPLSPAGSNPYRSPGTPVYDEKDALHPSLSPSASRPGLANQYASDRFLNPHRLAGSTSSRKTRKYGKERGCMPTDPKKRKLCLWGIPLLVVLVGAAAVGVVVGVLKAHQTTTSGSDSSSGSSSSGSSSGKGSTTGGKNGGTQSTYNTTLFGVAGSGSTGTVVTTDLGVQFTYNNPFGGSWAQNPSNPYSVSGRAQEWSPSMLEKWVWGQHIVRGVNLGGWLVTEPFIVPGLYEEYHNTTPKAVDEYTLSQAMGADLATKMEEHYATFITEMDFAEIAAAGLNWVRIAIGFWAFDVADDEPYFPKRSWDYFTKAVAWGRKYGIRIYLDFHGLPGSQNGWNHSGKGGSINWMYGVMGIANAQRALEEVRSVAEYISQPGITEVVAAFGLVNEVEAAFIGMNQVQQYYYQAYDLIRKISGFGAGNGPVVVLHEAFEGIAVWENFLQGADRIAIDQHPYLAFWPANNNGWNAWQTSACGWGSGTNASQSNFGITLGGEWSLAVNDCAYQLDGVDSLPAYTAAGFTNCSAWEDWQSWDQPMKDGLYGYAQANMDALQNWFFWTWKIGNSTLHPEGTAPMWHYRLGLQNGWIPADPRIAGGYCARSGVGGTQFDGTFPPAATGAVPTPTISPAALVNATVWPPTQLAATSISTAGAATFTIGQYDQAQIALFPTLTQTGTRNVLATPTHPGNATMVGSGWAQPTDTAGAWVKVQGCTYPDSYNATGSADIPTAACTGS